MALVGGLCLLAAVAFVLVDPGQIFHSLRESIFDRLLASSPRPQATNSVMVVDIDRNSLAALGAWPWPRGKLASLVDKIADAKPKALAINILLPFDERGVPDPEDETLAALARIPCVLAVVLTRRPAGAFCRCFRGGRRRR